ncbi:MAG: hypothetical protein RR359_02800 [Bacilli bacterium]
MNKLILGEDKVELNYMNNIYTDEYYNRVIATLCLANANTISKKFPTKFSKGREGKKCSDFIIENSDMTIMFSTKKSVDDMIDRLINMRDNTDWGWRDE